MLRCVPAMLVAGAMLNASVSGGHSGEPDDPMGKSRNMGPLADPVDSYAALHLEVSEYAYPLAGGSSPLRTLVVALSNHGAEAVFQGFMGGPSANPVTAYALKPAVAKALLAKACSITSRFQMKSTALQRPAYAIEIAVASDSGRLACVFYRPEVPVYEGPIEAFLTELDEAVRVPKAFRMGGLPRAGGRAIDALPASGRAPRSSPQGQ